MTPTSSVQLSKRIAITGAAIAVIGLIAISSAAVSHADTTNYKQAFAAGNASTSGIFNVAGDEGSITYALGGATSGSLECYGNSGSLVDIADLSGSGTLTGSSILAAGSMCNPNITTTAHLIQAMREGKLYLVSGGSELQLMGAAISMTPPMVTATSTMPTMGTTTPTMGSTTPTMGTTTVGMPNAAASNLRVALNVLLDQHVVTSIEVLRNISDNSPALAASLAAQDQNAVDLSNAIASVYGTAAGATFLQEFRAHIAASNAFTEGVKDGSMTDQTTALAALDVQLQNLSHFFANANPNISYDGLLAALRAHEVLVNDASVSYNQGNYTDSYTYEAQAVTQISGGADVLAGAIVAQFPNLFTN